MLNLSIMKTFKLRYLTIFLLLLAWNNQIAQAQNKADDIIGEWITKNKRWTCSYL